MRAAMLTTRGVVRGHVVPRPTGCKPATDARTLGSLAEEVHLSCSRLAKAFGAGTGVSPMGHQRQLEIDRADSPASGLTTKQAGRPGKSAGDHG